MPPTQPRTLGLTPRQAQCLIGYADAGATPRGVGAKTVTSLLQDDRGLLTIVDRLPNGEGGRVALGKAGRAVVAALRGEDLTEGTEVAALYPNAAWGEGRIIAVNDRPNMKRYTVRRHGDGMCGHFRREQLTTETTPGGHPALGERDRGYRVRREIPEGSQVEIRDGRETCATGTVVTYSNAGFRGIVAYLKMDDGTTVAEVPAGYLYLDDEA